MSILKSFSIYFSFSTLQYKSVFSFKFYFVCAKKSDKSSRAICKANVTFLVGNYEIICGNILRSTF